MLLLYTLARPILTRSAAEFNATLAEPNTSIAQCNDLGQCRSLSDVLWTCASVIFICTWVAVHPNVPHPKDRTMIRWVKDLLVTFFALIAPELMMLWSMRQYQASQLVWKKYEVYTGWTKAHAYLVVMGGFALYEQNQGQDTCLGILRDRDKLEDEPKHLREAFFRMKDTFPTLGIQVDQGQGSVNGIMRNGTDPPPSCLLELLLTQGFINITKDEVMALGEGDGLSKIIVIVEVGWFVLQCIARLAEGLVLTDVEVITLAHAAILGSSYYYWWNKPLRVGHVVRVTWTKKKVPVAPHISATSQGGHDKGFLDGVWTRIRKLLHTLRTYLDLAEVWEYLVSDSKASFEHYHPKPQSPGFDKSFNPHESRSRDSEEHYNAPSYFNWIPFIVFPIRVFREALLPCYRPHSLFDIGIRPQRLSPPRPSGHWRQPLPLPSPPKPSDTGNRVYIVGLAFAVIHFIPWNTPFPTEIESTIWRVSTITLMVVPPAILPFHHLSYEYFHTTWEAPANIALYCLSGIYVVARFATIFVAFATLRALPYSALQLIEWTQFIPHLG